MTFSGATTITILDPTCGSGAFLFAALNILEPLYEACIERMEQFTAETPRRYKFFHEVLARVNSEEHPNLQYYIYKTIILNNLYGVDIMHEAVEIAKLRLFLKMVDAVDMNLRKPNFGLEPLPDIDFNIRAGNTLVGFATEAEFKNAVKSIEPLFAPKIIKDFEDEFRITATAFKRFQDVQLITDKGEDTHKKAKAELQTRLAALNEKLNVYLASTYEIDKNKFSDEKKFNKKYEEWHSSHQPFHWFAEFYEIINGSGGFDVIIGNPPYVEYAKVNNIYKIKNYLTEKCGNLYAYATERSITILTLNGKFGFIMPLSSVSTPRMENLTKLYVQNKLQLHLSFYAGDSNPSMLFNGVKSQLSIHLISKNHNGKVCTTNYIRWFDEYRNNLFSNLVLVEQKIQNLIFNKISSNIENGILEKLKLQKHSVANCFIKQSKNILYYRNASGSYYRLFLTNQPILFINDKPSISTTLKDIYLIFEKEIFHCLFSSSLFHWFWTVLSDNYHITKKEFLNFYFEYNTLAPEFKNNLMYLSRILMTDFDKNSKYRIEKDNRSGLERKVQIFEPRKSKPIIDEIDKILAKHYGFTEEELDFIINYDIKYRMGKALFGEDESEAEDE